jgi:hypothetical protein
LLVATMLVWPLAGQANIPRIPFQELSPTDALLAPRTVHRAAADSMPAATPEGMAGARTDQRRVEAVNVPTDATRVCPEAVLARLDD